MKRGKSYLRFISVFQIMLMISFIFSFSVILNSGVVGSQAIDAEGNPIDFFEYNDISHIPTPDKSGGSGGPKKAGIGAGAAISATQLKDIVEKGRSIDYVLNGETLASGVPEFKNGQYFIGDTQIVPNAPGSQIYYNDLWAGWGNGVLGNLAEGAFWALTVYAAINLLGPMFGLDDNTVDALSTAAVVGILVGKGLIGASQQFGGAFEILQQQLWGLSYATWAGVGVGVLIFVLMYKSEKTKTIQFTCLPWQAPLGGNDCELCNGGNLPCSEYQCRSLGQSCEIVNPGTSEEKCVWVNRNDINPPEISPLTNALLTDYRYLPDNSISPPDRGVQVVYEKSGDGCIPAFTPLSFGVKLNEPAACNIDTERKQNFDEMRVSLSSGLLKYNHTFALSLPSLESLKSENITIQNDGNFETYVRCRDANGNSNIATYVFKYCVDQGPDTTPPLIITTSILNNVPVAFQQSSVNLDLFVNEPSTCKWSHDNRDYDTMEETFNCKTGTFNFNAQALYKCSTTLTGIVDRKTNNFYFRCRDKPNAPLTDRNTNAESYKFTLIGTQPLIIDSIKPADGMIIKDSSETVKVSIEAETSQGYKQGEAICYYSSTGNDDNYIKFFETGTFKHKQDLYLGQGNYEFFIKCTDLGGNSDFKTINFVVDVDTTAPTIVRAYKEEDFLKLITDENGECVYSTFGCSYTFEEGTEITVIDGINHFTPWSTESDLYIKCKDEFGNRPLPSQCSIVVRPSEF